MAEPLDQLPEMRRDLRKVNRLIAELEAQLEQQPQVFRFENEDKLQQCLEAYQSTRDRIQARIALTEETARSRA
ncbi:hypothetical protein [Hymenobacter sp.]|uniref:hypothetical protein n=1 Tax=Hymenobacter sp. TaxID=1898978 RepID=UPI00286CCBA3|nr:hypothetical protein [Hymenobacter sp.]